MRSSTIVLVALLTVGSAACGGGSDDGASPTSPSPAGGGSANGGGGSCTRPGAPGNFAAAVSFNNVAFTWSGVGGANDYVITAGPNPNSVASLSTNTTQTGFNWNGVPPGRYYARVEARNTCGSGASSSEISFTIG